MNNRAYEILKKENEGMFFSLDELLELYTKYDNLITINKNNEDTVVFTSLRDEILTRMIVENVLEENGYSLNAAGEHIVWEKRQS